MADNFPVTPAASGLRARFGGMHPIVPWLLAGVVLLPLPMFLSNAYTQMSST